MEATRLCVQLCLRVQSRWGPHRWALRKAGNVKCSVEKKDGYWDVPFLRKIDLQLVKSRRVVGIRNVQLGWLWASGCANQG